ncbi:unnamed protein product, partial [Closterium sp. Naga37s-1]
MSVRRRRDYASRIDADPLDLAATSYVQGSSQAIGIKRDARGNASTHNEESSGRFAEQEALCPSQESVSVAEVGADGTHVTASPSVAEC